MNTIRDQAISITAGRAFRVLRKNAEMNNRTVSEQATTENIERAISDILSEGDIYVWAESAIQTGRQWARFSNEVRAKVIRYIG